MTKPTGHPSMPPPPEGLAGGQATYRDQPSDRSTHWRAEASTVRRLHRNTLRQCLCRPSDDSEDIFPKDFIVSLGPPPGYMGGKVFHDLDIAGDDKADGERTGANSNEMAYVRPL